MYRAEEEHGVGGPRVSRRQVINCDLYSILVFNCTTVDDVYAAYATVVAMGI